MKNKISKNHGSVDRSFFWTVKHFNLFTLWTRTHQIKERHTYTHKYKWTSWKLLDDQNDYR